MEILEQETGAATGPALEKTAPNGLHRRLLRVAGEDLRALHPRLALVSPLLALLPHACFNRLRTLIYRAVGIKIGPRSLALGTLTLTGYGRLWERLRIGSGCIVNAPFYADLGAEVVIGDEVSIGHHAVFITTDHEVGGPARRCAASKTASIVIEDGCWIGARATILPGVRIGRGSIVSAGSVVGADVAPNKVVAGAPARPIKSLPEDEATAA